MMNREQFMRSLERNLKKLRQEERQDILQDFAEHFDIGIENGKTEEEIAASLGSPQQIAKELLAQHYIKEAESTYSAGNILKAAWASLSLGFFNFTIVLGPLVALFALVFSGWVIGITFLAAPLLVVFKLIVHTEAFHIFDLFISLTMCGLGILISLGMMYVSRMVFQWFARYLRFNIKLVKGGLKHE